jgi:AAA domain-containing protein
MQSLARAFGRSGNTGRPLPETYKAFTVNKVLFRQSATSMIAGAPGAYKSTLALNLLVRWAKAGIYGLYFSADADEFTTAKRTAAILTGRTVDTVEAGMRSSSAHTYRTALMAMEHTRWVYKAADIEEIDRHMRGFEAVYGSFPQIVVIDNLLNMSEVGDDWTACREFLRNLDILARASECHVCVLHHTSESAYSQGFPPPRSAIMGKISQFPRLIITIGANLGTLNVAVVKNTNGPGDPSGQTFFPVRIDPERLTITDSGLFTQGVMPVG